MIVQRVAKKIYVLFPEREVEALRLTPLGRGLPKDKWIQYRFSPNGTLERTTPAGLSGDGPDRLLGQAQDAVVAFIKAGK